MLSVRASETPNLYADRGASLSPLWRFRFQCTDSAAALCALMHTDKQSAVRL